MEEKNLPNILQYPADYGACGFWRMLWPQLILNMKGKAAVTHSNLYIRDLIHYTRATAVHIQRSMKPAQYSFLEKLHDIKQRMKFKLIYEADDIIFPEDVPDYNLGKYELLKSPGFAKEIIELCDEVTVTTPFLREYFLKKTNQKSISVIPNFPPLFWIGDHFNEELILRNYRAHKERPRILYAGSYNHFNFEEGYAQNIPDDFSHVRDVIMATASDYKWVFVGGFPRSLSELVQRGKIEYHPWQTIDSYPRFLAKLQINMWIAPLIENDFNRAKSDLKFLEATALGHPIACQDISTYAIAPIKFKTGEDMLNRIEETLECEEFFLNSIRRARNLIEARWLEKEENFGKYLDVYCHPYGDSMRKYV